MSFLKGKPEDSAEPDEITFCIAGAQLVPAGDLRHERVHGWVSGRLFPWCGSRRKKKWEKSSGKYNGRFYVDFKRGEVS